MAAEQKIHEDKPANICGPISKCTSLRGITTALHFYQSIKNDAENMQQTGLLIIEYFTKYKHLLDDYTHLLNNHINAGNVNENNLQFEQIHDYICKHIKCDIQSCQQFVRNNRNRGREKTENDALTNANNDKKVVFYMDILDTIHCYFVHAFDVGFRIKCHDLKINDNQLTDEQHQIQIDNDHMDKSLLYKDKSMKTLKTYLVNKRRGLDKIAGLHRIENSKFMTTVTDPSKLHEIAVDPESKTDNDSNHNENKNIDRYSFGQRMYYWQKYKDNEWYVDRKYDNLKQEILTNSICNLSMEQYELSLHKAMEYIATNYCKRMTSCYSNHLLYYDIRGGVAIAVNNLLSIVLYTDYSKLCYEFSKTFRKLNKKESVSAMKGRNREFWNWSKLMRETVEYFGEPLWKCPVKIFYSGCSYLVLDTFVANFCGPTSTSVQLQVATIFAKIDGIILELEKADSPKAGHLRYFNCSLLSCYGSEDERLFCGGNFPLYFHSIRLMEYNHNYQHFVKALTIFNKAMNGQKNASIYSTKGNITNTSSFIINKLIKHQMKQNKNMKQIFPEYIYAIFESFCKNKTVITINTTVFCLQYSKITQYFVTNGDLVLVDNIVRLFPNCNELHVRSEGSKIELTSFYMESLLIILTKANKIGNVLPSQYWKAIWLHNIKRDNKQNIAEFQPLFRKINWHFKVQKSDSFSVNHLKLEPFNQSLSDNDITSNAKRFGSIPVWRTNSSAKRFAQSSASIYPQ